MDESHPLPHVILLDINMPKMNGLELLARIRTNPRTAHLMVFMMSTSANQTDRTAAYQNHVAGYIIKPLSATDFADSLQKLIRFIDLCAFP